VRIGGRGLTRRRQRGLRATAPLPGGCLLGLLVGHLLTQSEWETLKWNSSAAGGEKGPLLLAREIALESYCSEMTLPKADGEEEPQKLFLSSFGYGARLAARTRRPPSVSPWAGGPAEVQLRSLTLRLSRVAFDSATACSEYPVAD